ncbi:hypothetical protein MY3296_002720 [Beauveria thailandica]
MKLGLRRKWASRTRQNAWNHSSLTVKPANMIAGNGTELRDAERSSSVRTGQPLNKRHGDTIPVAANKVWNWNSGMLLDQA